jgi:hypothetical protein
MAVLRIALIVFLSVGLDLVPASALEALEVLEESETAVHRSSGRRAARPAAAVDRLAVTRPAAAFSAPAARRAPDRSRQPVAGSLARKVPPPVSDSASASEDPHIS